MKYQLFGKSGLRVSEICLGTMTFGEEFGWGSTKDASREVFDCFVECGGNFFDTANHYTKGTSEKLLGEFIKPKRDSYVVATKYSLSSNPLDPNASGNHRKNMFHSLHESLKRLNTDYIDLYWIHAWDYTTAVEEVLRALDDMVKAGKVLHIGASNTPSWVVSKANTIAQFTALPPFSGLQLEYSLIARTIEKEYFPMMDSLGLGSTAWSPLGMGVLTGKYLKEAGKESRFGINPGWGERYISEHNNSIAHLVVDIAKELNKTPAQVAINWIRQQKQKIIPIIGAKNKEQLKDSLGALEFELSQDHMNRLTDASQVRQSFPYEFLELENIKKLVLGTQFTHPVM